MAVRARTARLRSRLNRLANELPSAVSQANIELAGSTVRTMQEQARIDWGGDTDQVGFDVGRWNSIIDDIEVLPGGGFGILNVQKMGTAADYEAIEGIPGLWHMGRRMFDSFRRLIAERPANRVGLEQARQAIWGDKQPQWWFKNYGNRFPGAYSQGDGTYTVERVAFIMETEVERLVSQSVNGYLRSRGILV